MADKEEHIQDLCFNLDLIFNEIHYNDEGWEFDHNQWLLLVECILAEYARAFPNPETEIDHVTMAKEAVVSLNRLGLLDQEALLDIDVYSTDNGFFQEEESATISYALHKHGFSQEAILQALPTIGDINMEIEDSFNGQMRTLWNGWGDLLIKRTQKSIIDKDIDPEISYGIAASFVKGLTGLGNNFEPEAVKSFKKKFKVSSDFLDDMAFKLSISKERLHTDLALFMENSCNGCDPSKDPICLKQFKGLNMDVKCPLRPDIVVELEEGI